MKKIRPDIVCGNGPIQGFTLIELLAAIGVVAILAALLFIAMAAVRRHVREMTAVSEVKTLEAAWRQYYAQYQTWPSFAGTEADGIAVTGAAARILLGENEGGNNRLRLVFTEFSRFGQERNPVNPWGRTTSVSTEFCYYAKFDLDYDTVVRASADGCPPHDVKSAVIVWTFNPDAKAGDPRRVIGSWQP